MIHIADTLAPEHIALHLTAATPEAAIAATVALLRDSEDVLDWDRFSSELHGRPPCRVSDAADFGICVPHVRTGAVAAMVISAARLEQPMPFPDCPKPVRYIFCIGIPVALASDYLRIAGALMRIFTDVETEAALRGATAREVFVAVLSRLEMKI